MNEQEELEALLKEREETEERRQCLKALLEDAENLRKELDAIEGRWCNRGKLYALDLKIAVAQLKCEDANKPTVVFDSKDFWHRDKDYVVRKVTEKRIYIALRGDLHTSMFEIHGKAVSGNTQIDIEQTFGGPVPTPKEWKAKYGKA